MTISIGADWLFPVTQAAESKAAIEIENGVIRAIRPLESRDRYLPDVCILPGFVNAHTHLAYTNFRNRYDDLPFFRWIRQLTEEKKNWNDAYAAASTRSGIAECLRSGITTVADMSDIEAALNELHASPLRGVFYWEVFGVEKEQAERSWHFLQTDFQKLKRKFETTRLKIGVSPHSCYTVRPELFSKIAAWSEQQHIPVSFHAAESRAEEDFIAKRSGVIYDFLKTRAADWPVDAPSSIAHLEQTGILTVRPLLAHVVQSSRDDIQILRRHNVPVAHCPKSNAKFGHGIAPLYDLTNLGVTVGLGTDSAASNNRLDLFEEARFALFQARAATAEMVLTPQKLLEMMTIDGAAAMGLKNEIGSLEAGKKADFIAIRLPEKYAEPQEVLHHILYTASVQDIVSVFVDGKEIDLTEFGGQ